MALKTYFSKHWQHDTSYKYSWDTLIPKINSMQPNAVLDVGCGDNYFKDKIDNLTGIDPYNANADCLIHIEDYTSPFQYDVILALGSINFGQEDKIDEQIGAVDRLLMEDGDLFMRLNPGLDHHWNDESDGIEFFPWSKDRIEYYARMYGYNILDWQEDPNIHGAMRYYVHLKKVKNGF